MHSQLWPSGAWYKTYRHLLGELKSPVTPTFLIPLAPPPSHRVQRRSAKFAENRPISRQFAFTASDDKVVSTLRHADGAEEIVETAWLIGCDGAHSTVRH